MRLLIHSLLALTIGYAVMFLGGRLLAHWSVFEAWPLWLLMQAVFFWLALLFVIAILQTHLIFAPKKTPQDTRLSLPENASECWLENNLHAIWLPHSEATRALLYCHGNAGNISHRIASAQNLRTELGLSVLAFDYPGFGKSLGAPTEASCYASAEIALAWLKAQGFAEENIVLLGKSLGGGVATELALRHKNINALILSRTFYSLSDLSWRVFKLRLGPLLRHRFDTASKLPKIHTPILFISGGEDTLCPAILSEKLYQRANEPKRLLVLSHDRHNDPDDARFFAAVREWIQH
jgi:uncharacterized protein